MHTLATLAVVSDGRRVGSHDCDSIATRGAEHMLLAVRLRRCQSLLLVCLWAVGNLSADMAAATTLPAPVHSSEQDCPTPRATVMVAGSLEVHVQLGGGVGAVQPGRPPGPPRVLGPIPGAAVQVLDTQTP